LPGAMLCKHITKTTLQLGGTSARKALGMMKL